MQGSSTLEPTSLLLDDHELVARLREGDEAAYGCVLDRYYSAMLHVAVGFVPSRAIAEEVVQDTWLAVIKGIAGFEERCSFKTWLFQILVNRARSRGVQEHRCIAFSSLAGEPSSGCEPDRLLGAAAVSWRQRQPCDVSLNNELAAVICSAIDRLPARQRQVLVLRDVEEWSAAEVCELLALSEENQRVLLHRARTRIRAQLVPYIKDARRWRMAASSRP
jgi:RNA polymerase sigma-70 factor (ECF subfamily)